MDLMLSCFLFYKYKSLFKFAFQNKDYVIWLDRIGGKQCQIMNIVTPSSAMKMMLQEQPRVPGAEIHVNTSQVNIH